MKTKYPLLAAALAVLALNPLALRAQVFDQAAVDSNLAIRQSPRAVEQFPSLGRGPAAARTVGHSATPVRLAQAQPRQIEESLELRWLSGPRPVARSVRGEALVGRAPALSNPRLAEELPWLKRAPALTPVERRFEVAPVR